VRVRGGVVQTLRPSDGLPAETLHAMVEDAAGSVWLSSNRGVFRTSRAALEAALDGDDQALYFAHYGLEDGLRSTECNSGYPSAGRDADGWISFPTMRGLARIAPASPTPERPPPVPSIRRLAVDSVDRPLTGPHRLPPESRAVSIHYSAPDLVDPDGLTYRYRLDGHDEGWVEVEHRREALWTNLAPGAYTFRVQARDAAGVPSRADATLDFTVEARLVDRPWFRGLLAAGALLGIVGLVRGQLHRVREQRLATLVQARTGELQAAHDHAAEQAGRLARQAEALEAADVLKARFFANVSHELRTPLTLIRGPVQVALSAGQPLSGPDLLRVDRSARRLDQLIEELLDIARLDAGRLPLRARCGDLTAHVSERVAAFAHLARERGVALDCAGPPVEAWFDGARIDKVVDNLLTNALRHTPAGGDVRVRVWATDTHAEVQVADTGAGIDPQHVPHLFERFYQATGAGGGGPGSAGLGLALSHELALRHGGALHVETEVGQGSVFRLRLPLGCAHLEPADRVEPDDGEALPAAPPAPARAPGESPPAVAEADRSEGDTTVLVVEDDADMRGWLRQVLAPWHAVVEAADGEEGLELARSHMPDLVLTDAMMPGMNGSELCAALRDDPATSHLPVVMLSARRATDSRIEGLASGADAYLGKPFDPQELLLQLANLLEARRRLQVRHQQRLAMADHTPEVASAEDRFLAQVRDAVLANFSQEDFGVQGLSDAVFMSRRQLGRKLTALIGEPPSALIRRIRVQRGRALIEQGAGTLSEIAYTIGYRRPARFSEQFRAEFGMSPSEFRDGLG